MKGAQCPEPVKFRVPSIIMISVKKNIDFLVVPEQTLSAMGQPGAARAQPLYMCVRQASRVCKQKFSHLYSFYPGILFNSTA